MEVIMAAIIIGLVLMSSLYVVWSLHSSYVKSMHKVLEMYAEQAKSMHIIQKGQTLEEIQSHAALEARQALEIEELRSAYQDEARARQETARMAAEAVAEVNGQIAVEGVGEAAGKRNVSMAEFYRRFEEVV